MPRAARSAPRSTARGLEAVQRLKLRNELAAVGRASEWLAALAADAALAPDDCYRLDLCAAELLTNIVSYAYEDERGHEIEVAVALNGRPVGPESADDGRPFDPTAHRLPQPATSLAAARWGGWGLRIVRQFADECRYERRGGRNVVSLVFNRQPAPAAAQAKPAARGTDRRGNSTAVA